MKMNELPQHEKDLLSITEKMAKMEGVALGMYYAARLTGDTTGAQLACDLKRDISTALSQVLTLPLSTL